MKLSDIQTLMAQFDQSSLREFSYTGEDGHLSFSKNEGRLLEMTPSKEPSEIEVISNDEVASLEKEVLSQSNGEVVTSPLVGIAYLSSSPEHPPFVAVGDSVKKGQTLLIVEAMKVMNEIPAPCDGVVKAILVDNEEMVDFGKGLVEFV